MVAGGPDAGRALREVAGVFLRLGCTALGGPAAHIALMRRELVGRRAWVTDARFLDLVSATALLPGPNSTELAMCLGLGRAGWPGLVVAGVLFIAPAMLLVLGLAAAYVTWGRLPAVEGALYGLKPVVVAVVVEAVVGLGRTAVKGPATGVVAVAALGLALLGVHEVALLGGAAAAGGLLGGARRRGGRGAAGLLLAAALLVPSAARAAAARVAGARSLGVLFGACLRIGAVLYGSGYVVVALLRSEFVERLGWLTDRQLLDAVAVGQLTPGPVLTAATFVGYLVAGLPGGLVATLGIFLPAFACAGVSGRVVPWLRARHWTAAALDSVNAASLGLMAAAAVGLGRGALVDVPTALLGAGALLLLLGGRGRAATLLATGAALGVLLRLVR